MIYNIKKEEKGFTFNIGDLDLSFVHEMVNGGIDGESRDVCFEDNTDYSKIEVSVKELNEFSKKYNLKLRF